MSMVYPCGALVMSIIGIAVTAMGRPSLGMAGVGTGIVFALLAIAEAIGDKEQ